MTPFTLALAPIAALIALGYLLKRTQFLPVETWPGVEKLTYFVLFPALLVGNLSRQNLTGLPWEQMLIAIVGVLLAVSGVLVVAHQAGWLGSPATFTSVFQGGVRFNTYISLAVAQGLYGREGLALATVAAGFMILFINLLCVSAFVFWRNQGAHRFVKEIAYNPLILGCVIGWGIGLSGWSLPMVVQDTLDILGRAALPFGLLAVGAALMPRYLMGHAKSITVASFVQFAMKPVLASALCLALGLNGLYAAVVLIGFITPTAPSGYILARQLGGDTETMASIITFQTLAAFLIMPLLGSLLSVFM